MPKFEFLVVEKLTKTVVIEADDKDQAQEVIDHVDSTDSRLWDMNGADSERYYELEGYDSSFKADFTKEVLDAKV